MGQMGSRGGTQEAAKAESVVTQVVLGYSQFGAGATIVLQAIDRLSHGSENGEAEVQLVHHEQPTLGWARCVRH